MFNAAKKMKTPSRPARRFDPITVAKDMVQRLPQALPREAMRNRILDVLFKVGIPFNRWLGLHIKEFTPVQVTIESPATVLRENHVGSAHACAQALIGEYAAGLVIAQQFPFDSNRMLIKKLEIDYHKPAHGTLLGVSRAPERWPEMIDGSLFVDMTTEIKNQDGQVVSTCKTRWQVKEWAKVAER